MSFRISALDVDQFQHLFAANNEELSRRSVRRVVVDSKPGYPCRVTLQDAEIGETVLLMNYEHQSAATPFRSSHAIFVRERASQARPEVGTIPEMFRHRLHSVRAFDSAGMMIDADVIDGEKLESLIERLFANPAVQDPHIHNAKQGCYAAKVTRQ